MRAGSVKAAHRDNHRGRGGSIPASALTFCVGKSDDLKELVMKYHYSRRIPGNIVLVGTLHESGGLFGDIGRAVCGLSFSSPPTRWSEPVVELTRLVRREDCQGVPLTLLVKLSMNALRETGKHSLAVSFADKTQLHTGFVYQACSWNYAGCRERRMDGLMVDGRFIPGRSCNAMWGTQSPRKVQALFPSATIDPHYDEGKHLYWKAITKEGKSSAERLGLLSLEYPK